jgi:hypothetical protein
MVHKERILKMNSIMTLYYNTVCQNAQNAKYPYKLEVRCTDDLKKIVMYDHVCADYKDNYRKNSNFIQSDCNMFDVDNTETDNPDEWVYPFDVKNAFPNVPFYVSYSRNHMKPKGGKSPRPKFHVYFSDVKITDCEEYKRHKESVCRYFPEFDPNAKDAARFFFGVQYPNVEFFSGDVLLYDFMKTVSNNADKQPMAEITQQSENNTNIIPQGQRNTSMHRFALCVLTRYGDSDNTAYRAFIKESERCSPPLEDTELSTIWSGAVSYYNQTIRTSSDYVPPQKYNHKPQSNSFELPVVDSNALMTLCATDSKSRKFDISVARLFLRAFGLSIRLNDMNNHIEVNGLPSRFSTANAYEVLETLIADTASKLFYKRIQSSVIHSVLYVIANENHYHPVIKLLDCEPWDGIDRLTEIYNIMGIYDDFHKSLVKKWAIQTIAVLYNSDENPIATQGLLVLQGEQGIGKTQLFRHLAIKEQFFKGGAVLDMRNKDTLMSATKVWICELGELDCTTKKEQSAVKAFLTEQTDRFREPYARNEIVRPRRTSFCGTVNPKAFLCDETGNRRYWTISVDKIDIRKIFEYDSEWYAQFWRQIHAEYINNPKGYLLTKDEQDIVNRSNEQFETLLSGEDEFITMFDTETEQSKWQPLTAAQIADLLNEQFHGLNISSVNVGKQLIPRIEKRIGIVFKRTKTNGKRVIYCPPYRIK